MNDWNQKQRFFAALAGEPADRPVVSAWRHFIDKEHCAEDTAESMINFQLQFNWDFVKINPRATYYAEAWGNRYDFAHYDGVVPQVSHFILHQPEDVVRVKELSGDAGAFGEQLRSIELIRKALGNDIPILQTVFSPLAVLEYLAGHRTLAGHRPAKREDTPLPALFKSAPELVHHALENITRTLENYTRQALKAGADGFFYAELGLKRDGYLNQDEFETYGRSYDLKILKTLRDVPVILHTCGPYSHPEYFLSYPVEVLHWDDRAQGNPSLRELSERDKRKCVMGGIDETLFIDAQDADIVFSEAKRLTKEMSGRPFLLAPGCGLPINSRTENIKALRMSVE